jgi:hypothetical protein
MGLNLCGMGNLGIRFIKNHLLFKLSFLVGLCGGISSILVDIDHYLSYKKVDFGFILEGRPLHIILAICASLLLVYSYTRFGGCFHKVILKSKSLLLVIGIIIIMLCLEYLWIMFMGNI